MIIDNYTSLDEGKLSAVKNPNAMLKKKTKQGRKES